MREPLVLLLVDDERPILDFLVTALPRLQPELEIWTAVDGDDAVTAARLLLPDAIVMDVAMPKLDGREATRRLKAHQSTSRVPIIALTGAVWDSQSLLDAGFDSYLTKPCAAERLVEELRRMTDRRSRLRSLRQDVVDPGFVAQLRVSPVVARSH